MKEKIQLTFPIPPSVNHLFPTNRNGKRYKHPDYVAWIDACEESMLNQPKYRIEGDKWLRVSYTYYFPLRNKGNGKKKIKDVFNYEKALSDFLSDHLEGFEDHKILVGVVKKIDSERNEVHVLITEIDETAYSSVPKSY